MLQIRISNSLLTSFSSNLQQAAQLYLHFRDERLIDDGASLHVAVVRGRDLVDHFTMLLREYHILIRQVRLQPVPNSKYVC